MIDENLPQRQPFRLDPAVSPLIQLRNYLGYDRKTFGQLLGVDYDTIWQWETGRRSPTFTWVQIVKLEEIFISAGIKFSDFPRTSAPHLIQESCDHLAALPGLDAYYCPTCKHAIKYPTPKYMQLNEATDLINELVSMSQNNLEPLDSEDRCIFLGENKTRVREIGQKLHDLGEMDLMIHAANQIIGFDQRELDYAWDGIGEWKC